MKKGYIVGLIIVAIAGAILVSTIGQASMYVTLAGAEKLYKKGDDREVHIVGSLLKESDGSVKGLFYDPLVDPNRSEFMIQDDSSRVGKVILLSSLPQDFDKSEKVVVQGKYMGNDFVASQVLLKCPSKYENKEIN